MNDSTLSNSSSSSCYDIDVFCNYSVLIKYCNQSEYEFILGVNENLIDTTYFINSDKNNISYFYNINYGETDKQQLIESYVKMKDTKSYDLSLSKINKKKQYKIELGETVYIVYKYVNKIVKILQIFKKKSDSEFFSQINGGIIGGFIINKIYNTCYEYEHLSINEY